MPHPGDGCGPTVREVLQRHAPGVIRAFPPRTSFDKLYVLRQLTECRTGLHGSHAWHCRWCGHSQISHNGCNNRHCASCGQRKRLEWVDRILGWSLPIDYLHCVVTLPHEFIPLILANDNAMYRLFFACVGRTLRELALEKHGAQVGVVMVLHSWGQRMNAHPHIHTIVTVGGLSVDENRWVTVAADSMFAREEVSERFRKLFVAGVRQLYRRQQLTLPSDMKWIGGEEELERWLEWTQQKPWQANVQTAPPHCQGPEAVVKYLAGYVVGSAIRDSRILRHDGRCVVIRVKNYRTGQYEELPMTGEEFVERFALHILPRGFLRVRYVGLFSAQRRAARLAKCRVLCGLPLPSESGNAADQPRADSAEEETVEQQEQEEAPTREPYAPDCRRCAMPGMQSLGRMTVQATNWFVAGLLAFHRQVFTQLSTLDDCHTYFPLMDVSLDGLPAMEDPIEVQFGPLCEGLIPDI